MTDTEHRRIRWTSPAPAPRCDLCERDAEWQIGTNVPFKSRASFFCSEHVPRWVVEAHEKDKEA